MKLSTSIADDGMDNWASSRVSAMPINTVTSIIPAGGRGQRLGCVGGKPLLKINGKTLLEWVLDLVSPYSTEIVIVQSVENPIPRSLLNRYPSRIRVVDQLQAKGSLNAVEIACPLVQTPYTVVSWVDQITIRRESIEKCLVAAYQDRGYSVVLPIVSVQDPYACLCLSGKGRIIQILQKREGDKLPAKGFKDTGFFIFDTQYLKEIVNDLNCRRNCIGRVTKEYDLLRTLPYFEDMGRGIRTIRVHDPLEGQDINTPEDKEWVERILNRRCLDGSSK